jgi:hypothetical protein
VDRCAPWIVVTEFDRDLNDRDEPNSVTELLFADFIATRDKAMAWTETQENADFYDEIGWNKVLKEFKDNPDDLFSYNDKPESTRIQSKVKALVKEYFQMANNSLMGTESFVRCALKSET